MEVKHAKQRHKQCLYYLVATAVSIYCTQHYCFVKVEFNKVPQRDWKQNASQFISMMTPLKIPQVKAFVIAINEQHWVYLNLLLFLKHTTLLVQYEGHILRMLLANKPNEYRLIEQHIAFHTILQELKNCKTLCHDAYCIIRSLHYTALKSKCIYMEVITKTTVYYIHFAIKNRIDHAGTTIKLEKQMD